jgi:hypothetical protein
MPWRPGDETIDENTSPEILQRIIVSAQHTSDITTVAAAGRAQAEIARREQKQRMEELLVQIDALQKITEGLIQSYHSLSERQAELAREQSDRQIRISRSAVLAAWCAAFAAFLSLLSSALFGWLGLGP